MLCHLRELVRIVTAGTFSVYAGKAERFSWNNFSPWDGAGILTHQDMSRANRSFLF